jgi:hypothetical protein
MAILNGQGVTSYTRKMVRAIEGAPGCGGGPIRDDPYTNPIPRQVNTITFTADADVSDEIVEDQVFRTTITEPDGTTHVVDYTIDSDDDTAGTDAEGLALVAGLVRDAINATATLNGIVVASAAAGVTTLTFDHAGIDYSVAFEIVPAVSETTLVSAVATSVSPAGSAIPFGRFVVQGAAVGGQRSFALPSAAAETALVGVLLRPLGVIPNQAGTLSTDNDVLPAGAIGSIRRAGPVYMKNVDTTDAAKNGAVFVVVATTGGDALGTARATDDSTNSVELPARVAYWAEDVPAGAVGEIQIVGM